MNSCSDKNKGFASRRDLISTMTGEGTTKKRVYSDEPLHLHGAFNIDFTSPTQPLLNNCKALVELTLADPKFVIMTDSADSKLTFELTDCYLFVPVATVEFELYKEIERKLKSQKAVYHFDRREILNYNLPVSTRIYNSDTMFIGTKLPAFVALCFAKTKNFEGSYDSNPYEFISFESSNGSQLRVDLTLNNVPIDQLILPGDASNKKIDYSRMFTMLQMNNSPITNGITLDMFENG